MAGIQLAEAEFAKQTKAVRPKGHYQMRTENQSRDPICRTQRGFLVYLSSSQLSPQLSLTHGTASTMVLSLRKSRSIGRRLRTQAQGGDFAE